jgi:hypothetical protein
MAVLAVSQFATAPGKAAEAQSLLKEALEIIVGLGAKGSVSTIARGGMPGTLSIVTEFDNVETYGAYLDRVNADQGMQKFTQRAQASHALNPLRSVDYNEIPGLEVPYADIAKAGAIQATLFRVKDGKQAQSLERIKRSKALMEKHGAKVRALQSFASDPFGITATVAYYANFAAWGKASKTLAADTEWQKFGAEIMGEQASSEFLRSMLLRAI